MKLIFLFIGILILLDYCYTQLTIVGSEPSYGSAPRLNIKKSIITKKPLGHMYWGKDGPRETWPHNVCVSPRLKVEGSSSSLGLVKGSKPFSERRSKGNRGNEVCGKRSGLGRKEVGCEIKSYDPTICGTPKILGAEESSSWHPSQLPMLVSCRSLWSLIGSNMRI